MNMELTFPEDAREAALGALTYHAILQGGDPLSLHGWLAVLVAVLLWSP